MALGACGYDAQAPGAATTLRLALSEEGDLASIVDAGIVHLEGPTPRTIPIRPGETKSIAGLLPGNYRVTLEGFQAGQVALLGETDVTVLAGREQGADIQLRSFVPESLNVPDEAVRGQPVTVRYSPVPGATSYFVEWSDDPGFTGAQSIEVTADSATFEVVTEGSHHVRVRARNRFDSLGVPAAASLLVIDPCGRTVGTIAVGETVSGTLGPGDCVRRDGRFQDRWGLVLPSARTFAATLSSTDFAPTIFSFVEGEAQVAGRALESPGAITAEHVLPSGPYLIFATSTFIDSLAPPTGAYTLSATEVGEPQVGCIATAFVISGSVAAARITPDDCETVFDEDPDLIRRYDGYSILLGAGESVSVTLSADFPFHFTRWSELAFQEGIFDIPAGESRAITVTAATLAFHDFYVVADHPESGSYVMTFSPISGGGALPARVAPALRFAPRFLPLVRPR